MSKEYTRVHILLRRSLRTLSLLMLISGAPTYAGDDILGAPPLSEPPVPPPGIPASGPDTAPLPPGTESPAYDAIRERCGIALDQRSCIEAAKRDGPPSAPTRPPAH